MIDCIRLKNLRVGRGLTQKQISSYLGITERGYQGYELNDTSPSLKMLVKLAEYFNVSTDYLLGVSDDPRRR